MLVEVNDTTFEAEVLHDEGYVLVDYYSNSCRPCRNLMPKLENVSESLPAAKIVKVNVESNFESAMRNKIKMIPTLVLYKDGKVVDTFRGCSTMSEDEIAKLLV